MVDVKSAASIMDFPEVLKQLMVKEICHEDFREPSSTVAESLGYGEMPSFGQIGTWNKDLSCLQNFAFTELYEYQSCQQQGQSFDKKTLNACKSINNVASQAPKKSRIL